MANEQDGHDPQREPDTDESAPGHGDHGGHGARPRQDIEHAGHGEHGDGAPHQQGRAAADHEQHGGSHDESKGRGASHGGAHGGQGAHGGGHAGHAEAYRRKFWIALVLTIPLVVMSEMVQDWFGYSLPAFWGDGVIPPLLGTAVFAYGGWPFLSGAWGELRGLRPGMMLLISLAIVVAFIASLASEVTAFELEFWWELGTLITIMLLGHWQEMRALGQAQDALQSLSELLPHEAERVADSGETEQVPVDQLVTGDVVLIRPGGSVPVDGEIVEGSADLDESVITGESNPVSRGEGERVVAGAVVAGSAIRVRVTATGDETTLAGIRRMIAEAQGSKSRAQALADRAAAALFFIAVAAGVLTFTVWMALGQGDDAVVRTVAVLVIACPHALGLAIPLVVSLATGISARAGLLVRNRMAFESLRSVDTVLFDKTGTLTRGEHQVTGTAAGDGFNEGTVLRLAGSVESDSEHPLARAIVAKAREQGELPRAGDFTSMAGRGVEASVEGVRVAVGGPALLRERQFEVPEDIRARTEPWAERGAAILYVAREDAVIGALALEDAIREESYEAVRGLQAEGMRVAMITGDAKQVANAVARDLGIDEVFAEVLPEDKDKAVIKLQSEGRRVAMVGDGVNDAPALARADTGIAIGAGTDVAIASAGIVLAASDPRGVLRAVRLSQATYRKMVQNLGWAAGYNVVALPLAAGVLASWGFVLAPAVGAILMSGSTVIVALNAQLLRKAQI